jgi:hypothetical protein
MLPLLPLLAPTLLAPAFAGSLASLPDFGYARASSVPQLVEVRPEIRALVHPTTGFPELVEPGGVFDAWVRTSCAPDPATLEARLELVGAPEVLVPLTVEDVEAPPGLGPEIRRITLGIPVDVGADVYALRLRDEGCLDDAQATAVRIHRPSSRFRFAVLADEQVGDPRGRIEGRPPNGVGFPAWSADPAARQRAQVRNELAFLDPLFVLYPGDAVFGLDYSEEYREAHRSFEGSRFATFLVPGNHDAYADQAMRIRGGWQSRLPGLMPCILGVRSLDPFITALQVGGCLLGHLSTELELRLSTDGSVAFKQVFGPDTYAFTAGGVRFVGVNTYAGSQERRKALPISTAILQRALGVPMPASIASMGAPLVDNYGGMVDESTLRFVAEQAAAAREAGEGLVVFGHHDPTGLHRGTPGLFVNQAFGTDPVSRGGFEVWNREADEPADRHTGIRLLEAMRGPRELSFFSGHTHRDASMMAEASGQTVRVVQTTTGGSAPADAAAYRGYRLVTVDHGLLEQVDYLPARGWGSIPIGHVWVEPSPGLLPATPNQTVVQELPTPMSGRLRFVLPRTGEGWTLKARGQTELPLSDVLDHGDSLVLWVEVEAPAASPETPTRVGIAYAPADGNQPPRPSIHLQGESRRRQAKQRRMRVRQDRTITLDAASTEDEAPLAKALWTVESVGLEGTEVSWRFPEKGHYTVTLKVYDAHGVSAETTRELKVRRRFLGIF